MTLKSYLTSSLLVLALGIAVAQGPGYGRGAGRCDGTGIRQGQGQGRGGWWNRVTPTTQTQKTFVAQAAAMHGDLRTARQRLRLLRANGGSAQEIAAAQKAVTDLQAKVTRLQTQNQATMRQLGANCTGVCDGTGPKGMGRGRGGNRGQCPYGNPPAQP